MAIIRKAFESDLESINSILRINGQLSDVGDGDIGDFIVAETDGEVVGCGMLREHGECAEIRKVSVLPEHQGRGIGKDISLALLERARGRKCWLLSVDSHPFWEQFGFYILPEKEEPREAKEYCARCAQRRDCDRVVMFREG